MLDLPKMFQPLLTEITGKHTPEAGEPWHWEWWQRLGLSAVTLVTGVTLSQIGVNQGGLALTLVVPGILLTTSVLRSFTTSYTHHASHGNLIPSARKGKDTKRKPTNDLLGDALSILALSQNLPEYRKDHTEGHHPQLATLSDPDLIFLSESLGFRPGQTIKQYWKHLWKTIFSPRFHFKFLGSRLKSNFITASKGRITASVVFHTILLMLVISNPLAWIISWIIPLALSQISALFQVVTEHNFVRQTKKGLETVMKLTSARFYGEALPKGGLRRILWATKMLTVHLPQKLFVVGTTDLANHDIHHVRAKDDWPNAAELRSRYLQESKHAGNFTENWGLKAQLEATFQKLSELPQDATLGVFETYGKDPQNSKYSGI